MNKSNNQERIAELEKELTVKKQELAELKRNSLNEQIEDYSLKGSNGSEVNISKLFGSRDELMVIHNMGKGCPYCTLWADGLNGVINHLENRAELVMVSPDNPETQKTFADSRGWDFKMLSGEGSSFIKDMGFQSEDGSSMPGFSVFKKTADGKMYRTSKDYFGPHDNYSGIWHMFDLLPEGINGWEPKFSYE